MAFILDDRVREGSTTTGTGAIALGGAVGGYQAFGAVMSNADTCWYAIVLPGSAWETGLGTYNASGNTLSRTSVISSSNAGSLVNFVAGTKDVFITQPAKKAQPFPAGTLMLFQQSAAPVFWTKQTTHNDKALRVVSGAASSGGTTAFSSCFNNTLAVSNTTITQSTMASHSHVIGAAALNTPVGGGSTAQPLISGAGTAVTSSIGGDNSHGHLINIAVAYVDLIICQKDS